MALYISAKLTLNDFSQGVPTTGRSVAAKVVDECDSVKGCDLEHAGLPQCGNNVVDGFVGVWNTFGLNKDLGVVNVSWIIAE
ncbi:hypothetical protein PRUPE_6G105500 [Prunus persica]|uniref:Barwin domain-containing protein n=1 Tax=Prunus persica TaxID=3760 RepID=M5W1W8_PRUPE|nr:hypothetical protein PRUPE_6G105500 [Prunus persica]